MLELRNLSKKYQDKEILKQVSLSLKKGEIALLLGHSGVGKTTLIRAINNLEKLDRGEIIFKGKILEQASMNQMQLVGMVFQSFNLFDHLNARDNLLLPLTLCMKKPKEEASHIVKKLLERFNLSDKTHSFPSQLSGGQKQRLAIARAIAMEPAVLCLDEPTSALDPKATNQVAKQIKELSEEGYILLIATHDTSLIEKLDCKIHLMQEGAIVESAQSSDFFSNPKNAPKIQLYLQGL